MSEFKIDIKNHWNTWTKHGVGKNPINKIKKLHNIEKLTYLKTMAVHADTEKNAIDACYRYVYKDLCDLYDCRKLLENLRWDEEKQAYTYFNGVYIEDDDSYEGTVTYFDKNTVDFFKRMLGIK